MPNKQDSNSSGLAIAKELRGSPKVLPGSGGADAIWYEREPNSYSDFGGKLTTVARDPINASRQRKRGAITDLEANGGLNEDLTQNNLAKLLPGFFFADPHKSAENSVATVTASGNIYTPTITLGSELSTNGAFASDTAWTKGTGWTIAAGVASSDGSQSGNSDLKQTIASVAADSYYQVSYTITRSAGTIRAIVGSTTGVSRNSAGTYTEVIKAGSDTTLNGMRADLDFIGTVDNLTIKLIPASNVTSVGDLLLASGFTTAANNGLKRVTAMTGALSIAVAETLVDGSTQSGVLKQVGYQFGSGDLTMTVTDGVATLGASSKNLLELNLNVGQWIFIGGDDEDNTAFATCPVGYGRVLSVSSTAIVLDKVTGTFVTDNGSGRTIQIFFGDFLRNERDPDLIVTDTYQLERQLGDDGDGIQAEYILGGVANEFTMNITAADKVTVDMDYMAMDREPRTGSEGLKIGTRVAALGEAPFNTSSDVYRIYMNVIDADTLQPSALFAYISEGTLNIKNNAEVNKAVSVLGGFDITVGTFEVSGSLTAYFTTNAAINAIVANSDVTLDIIFAKNNAGQVYDLPMLGLATDGVAVEKDKAITIPLDAQAAESPTGYTLSHTLFQYLPTAAMPA